MDEEQPVDDVGIESILHQLLDLMATAKSMPLSSSVMVSREEVASLVQSALECLPDELRQAALAPTSARSSWPSGAATPRR